ncbi:MAG: Uncharacterized protein FD161_4100 [Limisphaerales bacterium]|nr:MAG: Uncharacterized protein FD161_4100 [Limisphaerales bacterium]KAG0507178.1 MAG: Uncharacterized protein E1N63_3652 [Limisphaerales bacterium]TXT46983.1 MAG: Uncharacterized protein FD140_4338 [Limisphaerales bacterium]
MRKLVHLIPKPILFGLLGALGCVLGWAAGEPLLKVIKPPAPKEGEEAKGQPAAPVLVFSNELQKRLQREEAKTGDVQISLMWDNFNDLDLHCVDPTGERIFYGHKTSASRGELDVDMNARAPYSGQPVENIYWPTNDAPEGTYQVFVNHYSLHAPVNETPYTIAIKQGGKAQEFRGVIRHGQTNLVHSFEMKKAPPPDLAKLNQRQPPSLKTTLVIGLWTSLLAVGMAALIVATQNFLLRRALFSVKEAALVLGGGVLAGLISGAVSQHLFALGANSIAAQLSETDAERVLPLIIKAGQLVGWSLLGALLGFGLAFFIPNLPKFRAGFAGLIGGGLGAAAFLFALAKSGAAGDASARLVGAAILGLTIGLVVALVERLAREAALIVHWHENERTVINLGAEPVILGSSPEAHLYLPKHKGFPPVTAIVTFRDGRVQMENKLSNSTHTLAGGNKLQIGELWIEIQTDAK